MSELTQPASEEQLRAALARLAAGGPWQRIPADEHAATALLTDAISALLRLRDEVDRLRERCKPTAPPYLACLWHETFDHTCPWCLRHGLAAAEEDVARLRAALDDGQPAGERRHRPAAEEGVGTGHQDTMPEATSGSETGGSGRANPS